MGDGAIEVILSFLFNLANCNSSKQSVFLVFKFKFPLHLVSHRPHLQIVEQVVGHRVHDCVPIVESYLLVPLSHKCRTIHSRPDHIARPTRHSVPSLWPLQVHVSDRWVVRGLLHEDFGAINSHGFVGFT